MEATVLKDRLHAADSTAHTTVVLYQETALRVLHSEAAETAMAVEEAALTAEEAAAWAAEGAAMERAEAAEA